MVRNSLLNYNKYLKIFIYDNKNNTLECKSLLTSHTI